MDGARRWRGSIGVVLLSAWALFAVVTAPAADGATSEAQLYVATGDGYSIAFEVEDGEVSVLGLDATVYCSYTSPGRYFEPSLNAYFSLPTPTRRRGDDLIAGEGQSWEFGSERASVRLSWEEGMLSGKFRYLSSVESDHCQTGGYFPRRPAVPFEARRFVPVGDAEASAPTAEESGIYFSDEGPLETFLRTDEGRVYVRGSLASSCRFSGGSDGLYPLFRSAEDPAVDAAGSFRDEARYKGALGKDRRFFEPVQLSGIVGEDSIAGFYSRTRVIAKGAQGRHRCGTHPLPFTADRYVPAGSSATPE